MTNEDYQQPDYRKHIATTTTATNIPQPTPPPPAGAGTETDKLLHGQFRNHEGWRDHPFVILARKLEQQRDDARRQAEADRATIERLQADFNQVTANNLEFYRQKQEAERQLASADKDRERLEWLIEYRAHVTAHIDGMLDVWEPGRSFETARGVTARAAIDAAMQLSAPL